MGVLHLVTQAHRYEIPSQSFVELNRACYRYEPIILLTWLSVPFRLPLVSLNAHSNSQSDKIDHENAPVLALTDFRSVG